LLKGYKAACGVDAGEPYISWRTGIPDMGVSEVASHITPLPVVEINAGLKELLLAIDAGKTADNAVENVE